MTSEEIVQDVAMEVYKHWEEEWDDGLVRFVTHRRLVDLYRRRATRVCTQLELTEWWEPTYDSGALDTLLDVHKNWLKLSDRDKTVVQMVVEGRGHEEIAKHFNMSNANSRWILHRARLTLRGEGPISSRKRL
jgi:DNA-directed RNA polymerase specialized sigma24 family protein